MEPDSMHRTLDAARERAEVPIQVEHVPSCNVGCVGDIHRLLSDAEASAEYTEALRAGKGTT